MHEAMNIGNMSSTVCAYGYTYALLAKDPSNFGAGVVNRFVRRFLDHVQERQRFRFCLLSGCVPLSVQMYHPVSA